MRLIMLVLVIALLSLTACGQMPSQTVPEDCTSDPATGDMDCTFKWPEECTEVQPGIYDCRNKLGY